MNASDSLNSMQEKGYKLSFNVDKESFYSTDEFYMGIDPTGQRLHLGHLAVFISCVRIMEMGLGIKVLIGSATSTVGDPSGKSKERPVISASTVKENALNLHREVEEMISVLCKYRGILKDKVEIVDNLSWLKDVGIISFLREVGKYVSVASMVSRDSVKSRINTTGISFSEFTYQLLQAYDFKHLYENENVIGQLGGADQWGNIVSGIEIIKKTSCRFKEAGKSPVGITVPLLVNNNGEKFGKTASGAIWIFDGYSSASKIYQYILNTNDEMCETMENLLTFDGIAEDRKNDSVSYKLAIAEEVVRSIYGENILRQVQDSANLLYGKNHKLKVSEIKFSADDKNCICLNKYDKGTTLFDILKDMNILESKGEFKRLCVSGSIKIGERKITKDELVHEELSQHLDKLDAYIVKIGKKRLFIVHEIS